MILEYHRPTQVEKALELLERKAPHTIPLGGGTYLSQHAPDNVAVVDLQALGLKEVELEGNQVRIGACVDLQQLVESPIIPDALKEAIRLEATLNTRNSASLAGRLVTCDGASPLATALLAADARLTWLPGNQQVALGDWLPLRGSSQPGRLIIQITFPNAASVRFASVGRTPLDRPVVCAAVATWPSGRTRVVLGGAGPAPLLAMDGTDRSGADGAAENAYSHIESPLASSLYMKETAKQLVRRLLAD